MSSNPSTPTPADPPGPPLDTVACYGAELRYQAGSSDKWYRVMQAGKVVVFTYGRSGSVGQMEYKEYSSSYAARSAAISKIEAKRSKGYALSRCCEIQVPADSWLTCEKAGNAQNPAKEAFRAAWEDARPTNLPSTYYGMFTRAQDLEVKLPDHLEVWRSFL